MFVRLAIALIIKEVPIVTDDEKGFHVIDKFLPNV